MELDGTAIIAHGSGANTITPTIIEWFKKRNIDGETAINSGIYTEGADNAPVIVFPSYEGAKIVNRKFRGPDKKFWQQKGGKKTFFNISGLELAIVEQRPLVICEGEMDCLSVIQSGYAWVVSIPDGAPAKKSEFSSIEEDNKFRYLWNHKDQLDKVDCIILAGDNDEPGKTLNYEISKRLGIERCKFISYPDDCKDLNDVLVRYGSASLADLIDNAKYYPVVGLYLPCDFPHLPKSSLQTYETGMGFSHDEHLKLMLGKFMVITGVPGHGKSEWADSLTLNLAIKHGWRIGVLSTEISQRQFEKATIRRFLRRPLDNVGENEPQKAKDFYYNHYVHFTNETLDNEVELSIEKLIELAEISVIRYNCKVLLIDPWNELEHKRGKSETETEYTGRAIRLLKKFARLFNVLVIVVAHPKMPFQGKPVCPSLYSISGSANWYNKADYGVVLWRPDQTKPESKVKIAKIKIHGEMGKPGVIKVKLNAHTKRFEEI